MVQTPNLECTLLAILTCLFEVLFLKTFATEAIVRRKAHKSVIAVTFTSSSRNTVFFLFLSIPNLQRKKKKRTSHHGHLLSSVSPSRLGKMQSNSLVEVRDIDSFVKMIMPFQSRPMCSFKEDLWQQKIHL